MDRTFSCNQHHQHHQQRHQFSFNANLSLPRQSVAGRSNDAAAAAVRFEYSWKSTPDLSPSSARKNATSNHSSSSSSQFNNKQVLRSAATQTQFQPLPPPLLRKNSSSGYGSAEGSGAASSPYVNATWTFTSSGGGGASGAGQRTPHVYDRRCRSTCSITLENVREDSLVADVQEKKKGDAVQGLKEAREEAKEGDVKESRSPVLKAERAPRESSSAFYPLKWSLTPLSNSRASWDSHAAVAARADASASNRRTRSAARPLTDCLFDQPEPKDRHQPAGQVNEAEPVASASNCKVNKTTTKPDQQQHGLLNARPLKFCFI